MPTISVQGADELRAELKKLGGPTLRRVAKRATAQAMRPVLGAAKAAAPVESGRLRASIGQLATDSRRSGFVGARVGIRRNFTYRTTDKQKLVSGTGKQRDRALARGFAQDKTAAQQYAGGIHFGTDRKGRVRRKAGPVAFLDDPIRARAHSIVQAVADNLRAEIHALK